MMTVLVPGEALLIGDVLVTLVGGTPSRAMVRITKPSATPVSLLDDHEAEETMHALRGIDSIDLCPPEEPESLHA
ncbi:hypothetical protein [Tuwongella immobilis]|uniref:Uncharacterized protein n=1 Tax=Tuwongella immobilis TaxID=692036 RepID=A0A6C2YPN0_9BACT|nr:hypothetical protein [Tuwongella immobilis]VIP02985.1 unnamed protein product [Tuwongella immobilis]VTS03043.1 unnamed protein product [Tuwongella immobilis]